MKQASSRSSFLSKNIAAPIVVSILLVGMFLSFLYNFNKKNSTVDSDLQEYRTVVLSPNCDEIILSDIIYNDGYAESKTDAEFIAAVLVQRQKDNGRIPSLYTLQKRAHGQIPILLADSCKVMSSQQLVSRERLGQNDTVFMYTPNSISGEHGEMIVSVYKKVESSVWWRRILKIENEIPCTGVPVRLTSHFRDSLNQVRSAIVGFRMTDSTGVAVFDNLDIKASYSVLPIKQGFEYGTSKGTVGGKWGTKKSSSRLEYSFEEKEHRIPLFSNATLRQIKTEKTILTRSPDEFRAIVVRWFVLVIMSWWALYLYMVIRKKKFSGILLASCMFLTGLCVLMMFSMQDPLNDELHGVGMGQGVLLGLIVCLIFQEIDFVKFYQNKSKYSFDIPLNVFRWFFKPYRQKVYHLAISLKGDAAIFRKMLDTVLLLFALPFLLLDLLQITRLSKFIDKICEKLPKGTGWLLLALILTAMLWTPFGQSIGGMRVNLSIFGLVFQPSEIAKYLILLFMAAFFTQQADAIIAYSQPNRLKKIGSKLSTLLWIILGLSILMGLYIILGDMGPGLVIGITFILLYSLIKSKVNLINLNEGDRWKRILSCDFAMLVYGLLSFAVFLLIGYKLGNMLLFGVLWFAFWIALGYFGFKKQLFESALLMNAIIFLFIFGGQLLGYIPALKDSSTVERFEARTRMCVNTWGNLDIEHLGKNAEPVSNTQVANGLWALSSGGINGQGWVEGKPSLVPAFHTDMILSSIGEQLGWLGLLMVVIALAVLLRRMTVIGYNVGHPFAFYLCLGFAIVIGVQFFIIALGSSGIIPLTGVTVPFLSFGRVSMILNLAAFGIVLSLCNNIREEVFMGSTSLGQNSVAQYSYPIAMVSAVFLFFAVSTLFVWQYYQFWGRNDTLKHPAYVINNQGAPVVEYNPRINLLVRNMYAGRIYDRKGLLLATSDRSEIETKDYTCLGIAEEKISNMLKRNQNRYYPMGEQMFFMVGDQNEGLMFAYNENYPVGYMAEAQHLSYLRGFDNVLYDKSGEPVKVRLRTNRLRESLYLAPVDTVSEPILLRDYSELIKYLKDGIDGKKVARHNQRVKKEKYDLHLTVDAALQAELQDTIANYMKRVYGYDKKGKPRHKDFHLMRVSAVVIDAQNGDLLASANYPLPNYDRLRLESDNKYYSDNMKGADWHAYTDIDMGTTFRTMPGSTAKVVSAMAGLMQYGTNLSNQTYNITNEDAIEKNRSGVSIEPLGNVTMRKAIVESSNCYFINLVNDKDLYPSLETIYKAIGASIGGKVPYIFSAKTDTIWKVQFDTKISENRKTALAKYADYSESVKKGIHYKMDAAEWKWAWGQGWAQHELEASPLNMARVAATVVNNGKMPVTQYLLSKNKYEKQFRNENAIPLIEPAAAAILKNYMIAEAANQYYRQDHSVSLPSYVGGKTGTPERERVLSEHRKFNKWSKKYESYRKTEKLNDGWYMFFVEGDDYHHPIAVAVRMERGLGSGPAVRLTGNKLLDCLERHGYIRKK